MVTVGNNGGDVCNVVLGARSNDVGVRVIMTNGRDGNICVYCRFILERELAMCLTQATEHTPKA